MSIASLVEKIHVRDQKKVPYVEISDVSQETLVQLAASLLASNTKNTIAVIRCWDKTESELHQLSIRLQDMQARMSELKGVLVSVNADADTKGTAQTIDQMSVRHNMVLPMAALSVHEYSWTAGLNAPVALFGALCVDRKLDAQRQLLLSLSFDVQVSPEAQDEMAQRTRAGIPWTSVRVEQFPDTSESLKTQEAYEQLMVEDVRTLVRMIIDSHTGTMTHIEERYPHLLAIGRNTMAMYSLAEIVALGGFNPACNSWGGMEDHEFRLRKLLQATRHGTPEDVDHLFQAMEKPVRYVDPAWQAADADSRAFKYAHELQALRHIVQECSRQFAGLDTDSGIFIVPKERQDFFYI